MNRALPILVVVVSLLGIVGGGFLAFKKLSAPPAKSVTELEVKDETTDLTLEDSPYTTLVPGPSCEYTLNISKIKNSPASVEYEIIYKNGEGVTQGATGSIKPAGSTSASKKILFGSESSGKRRCDPDVSGGSITLRYRNNAGKVIGRASSNFSLVENGHTVSVDKLTVSFEKKATGRVLAMGTMGFPSSAPGKVSEGPYGVFTNLSSKISPTVKISGSGDLYAWSGTSWGKVTGATANLSALVLQAP
ncbi:MAG: hypothetical protein HYW33_00845 [Candidatus Blackburnbacteria bacterium]|nr:hypothetical protein [Candidatus Blackburnbacteria bacterium]